MNRAAYDRQKPYLDRVQAAAREALFSRFGAAPVPSLDPLALIGRSSVPKSAAVAPDRAPLLRTRSSESGQRLNPFKRRRTVSTFHAAAAEASSATSHHVVSQQTEEAASAESGGIAAAPETSSTPSAKPSSLPALARGASLEERVRQQGSSPQCFSTSPCGFTRHPPPTLQAVHLLEDALLPGVKEASSHVTVSGARVLAEQIEAAMADACGGRNKVRPAPHTRAPPPPPPADSRRRELARISRSGCGVSCSIFGSRRRGGE